MSSKDSHSNPAYSLQTVKPRNKFNKLKRLLTDPPEGLKLPAWPRFTQTIGGLQPGDFTLICAPTGTGKTTALSSLVSQLIVANYKAYAAPIETGEDSFLIKIIGALYGKDFLFGEKYNESEVNHAIDLFSKHTNHDNLILSTYDNRVSVEEMTANLQYLHNLNVPVAVLDNLNFFLEVTSAQNAVVEMDRAIHEFIITAKRFPIHIILVVHPRKTDNGRVESEFDLKGSSTAVQEASNVILFNRPTQEQIDNEGRSPNDRELIFKKLRHRGFNVNTKIWFRYANGFYSEID